MRRSIHAAGACLGAAAVALALYGDRALLARSLIPAALDHQVAAKLVRHEKRPGVDDVHFLLLAPRDGGAAVEHRVDRPAFDAVSEGAWLRKGAGERTLEVDGSAQELQPSPERTALRWVAVAVLAPAVLAALALRLPSGASC